MFKNAKEASLYDQTSKDKTSIKTFANEIEKIHRENKDWEHRRTALSDELNKLKISSSEINEFAYFHPNCVSIDSSLSFKIIKINFTDYPDVNIYFRPTPEI